MVNKKTVEYFKDGWFTWKIEGDVLTIQSYDFPPCSGDKDEIVKLTKKIQKDVEKNFERARKRGIKIIELWYAKDSVETAREELSKLGIKLEVVREERDGSIFCRLLL